MYRSPAEIPRARLPLLDQVTIKTPCREKWDAMVGDDRVRFCARCSKNVYDLSAMTQDEAEAFLATHLDDDDACVRLYRRPDGRILTSECMQGARNRHRINVGAAVVAGLCVAAATSMALANVHVANGMNLPKTHARIDVKRLAQANEDDAANAFPSDPVVPVSPYVPFRASDMLTGDRQDDISGFAMGGLALSEPPARQHGPLISEVSATVSPGLPRDVVRRIVRQNTGRIRLCYESRLTWNPVLTGHVVVKFLIGLDGSVVRSEDGGSDLPDPATVACIVRRFGNLAFPKPVPDVSVYVSYRVSLSPPP